MPEAWKQWEGQVVDGKYPLRQYLSGTEHSAVFLTEYSEPQPEKAAIKLIRADAATAELQLSRWRVAAQLSHPNLLRLFQMGRSKIGDTNLLYVVTEYAEEDLAQILPQRVLTPGEAREMLEPVLDALVYLHSKGLVHGHIKPANIHAAADQLKLSTDTLVPNTESKSGRRRPSPYDPPEAAATGLSVVGDVWSLGVTLVEALTQRLLARQPAEKEDPALPESLAPPFLEIARNSLRFDPHRRWTVAEIAARLNPAATAPSPAIAPVSIPVSTLSSPLPANRQAPKRQPPRAASLQQATPQQTKQPVPTRPVPLRQAPAAPLSSASAPRYFVPALAAALVIAAILVVPKLLNRGSVVQPTSSGASEQPSRELQGQRKVQPQPKREPTPVVSAAAGSAPSLARKSIKSASDKKPIEKEPRNPVAAAPDPEFGSDLPPKSSSSARGDILDEVLPDVSRKARDTIQGRVRVTVRIHVDPAGNVSDAELDSPGPSRYFADLALQAARRWEFQSPEVDGRSVASEWMIRFVFSQSDTKAFPIQQTP
jgi:eukaryotic-like serine/threonine-protein kinase